MENEPLSVASASVSRKVCQRLVEAALDAMSAASFEGAVAVVDPAGAMCAFARTDFARFLTIDLAIGKAWTAASLGHPTHIWNALVADPAHAPMAQLPRVVAVGGGYPLREKGRVVGAVGVSGGTTAQDQETALAAIVRAGFDAP
jgi:uncharacterized protein GlcG (DUF336 family)